MGDIIRQIIRRDNSEQAHKCATFRYPVTRILAEDISPSGVGGDGYNWGKHSTAQGGVIESSVVGVGMSGSKYV
jgi:hypothetical protein